MAWSTRQLADLAGVTLRSIRHWHDIGLLPEPERLANGYKQYTAQHLVLALRINRLAGLGFLLDDVARMLDSEEDGQKSLRGLRTELDTRIADLERIRSEVDELISLGVSPDLSPEALLAMEALGNDPASRNVALFLTHLIPKEDTLTFVRALKDAPEDLLHVNTAIQELPADASEHEIVPLVDRAVAAIRVFLAAHGNALPDFPDSARDRTNTDALTALITEHMNPAQRHTMRLIGEHFDRSPEWDIMFGAATLSPAEGRCAPATVPGGSDPGHRARRRP
ncbi:MerR family transcriptional regulator [Streptosporangium sp. NPDC050280]|uniref:helix-turn-helix domain-containing protein n=1 Tax=unclassified Streptosporangium TaxID=2632669 RepID=UPI0034356F49